MVDHKSTREGGSPFGTDTVNPSTLATDPIALNRRSPDTVRSVSDSKVEVLAQRRVLLRPARRVVPVDPFVLDRVPQPFDENVFEHSSSAVHTTPLSSLRVVCSL